MTKSVMPRLYSADVERAVAFYAISSAVRRRSGHPPEGRPSHVELRLGDVTIAISSREAVVAEGLPEPAAGHPMELVVWVDWTDDTVDSLRAAGAPVLIEPHSGHVSGMRRAYVADPDGNWLAVVSKDRA